MGAESVGKEDHRKVGQADIQIGVLRVELVQERVVSLIKAGYEEATFRQVGQKSSARDSSQPLAQEIVDLRGNRRR